MYRALFIIALACASCSGERPNDALLVEAVAVRSAVTRYPGLPLIVDSVLARANTAPPVATAEMRPRERHRALGGMVGAVSPSADAGVRIRMSRPVISGGSARITVTIDELCADRARACNYETLDLVLARKGNDWVVSTRTPLGVS